MTLDIHVTVELQPSPQLVELFRAMQPTGHNIRPQPGSSNLPTKPTIGDLDGLERPGPEQPEKKPQKAQEESKRYPPSSRPTRQIIEVPAFSEFTTDQPVHLSKNLYYAESENGLVMIKYLSGTIYTLWSEIMKACKEHINVKPIPSGRSGNKYTALNQFIKAVEGGLRKGQAAGSQEDLDADFKKQLTPGTIDTSTGYDGGKLEGYLEN